MAASFHRPYVAAGCQTGAVERIRVMRIIARMNVGGPAVEITELMRGLDPEAFEQRLVTGWCAEDEADYLMTQAPDVGATRIEGLGRSVRPWDDSAAFARLVGQIRQFRPDIVHTHTAKAGALGRTAARLSGIRCRVVHTHHGHLLHGYFGPATTRAVISAERALGAITDRMVAVGSKVRSDLLEAGIGRPDRFEVIHSGVAPGTSPAGQIPAREIQAREIPAREQARQLLGLADDAMVIAWVGRVTRIKRPDRLVDVTRLLAARFPRACIVVAGAGDQMPVLTSAVDTEALPIRLLGWRDDVETVFAASDLALLTSDNEGTPLSLAQAGLCGIPAVASDVGSVSDVVINGRSGLLVTPDATALADACARLIVDRPLRESLGAGAKEHIRREFSISTFLERHASLYRELAQGRPRP
jgi:glycosyltransferase involved in cell wall biosynthesis